MSNDEAGGYIDVGVVYVGFRRVESLLWVLLRVRVLCVILIECCWAGGSMVCVGL